MQAAQRGDKGSDVLLGVRRRQRHPQPGRAGGHGGRPDGGDVEPGA